MSRILLCIAVSLATLLAEGTPAPSVAILNVSADPAFFEPARGATTTILYRITTPSKVTARIWDSADRPVRALSSGRVEQAGDHRLVWDGRDDKGRLVPDEAYVYTLEAASGGQMAIHDLTDLEAGRDTAIADLRLDTATGTITYTLSNPSRVVIRISQGPEDGPLLATVVNFEPRPLLSNRESWDRWGSGRAKRHLGSGEASVKVSGSAWPLPANAVVVRGSPTLGPLLDGLAGPRRERRERPHIMYNHHLHRRDVCFDPDVTLRLAEGPGHRAVTPQAVSVQVRAAPEIEKFLTDQRAEIVFYVDGVFAFEEELGYLPFNWIWRPSGLSGSHIVTVNILGYEGHFATSSLEVMVPQASADR